MTNGRQGHVLHHYYSIHCEPFYLVHAGKVRNKIHYPMSNDQISWFKKIKTVLFSLSRYTDPPNPTRTGTSMYAFIYNTHGDTHTHTHTITLTHTYSLTLTHIHVYTYTYIYNHIYSCGLVHNGQIYKVCFVFGFEFGLY